MNSIKIIFAVFLFVISFFPVTKTFAVEDVQPAVMVKEEAPEAATMEATIGMEEKVEYTLPYPGILPDHPLFFVKRLRDQIMERLIADPVRKIEFYVLQADKYMNMGVFLLAKEKQALAQETMTISVGRMGMAVDIAVTLKNEGKDVPVHLVDRIMSALGKYHEVATNAGFSSIDERVVALQEEAAKLK